MAREQIGRTNLKCYNECYHSTNLTNQRESENIRDEWKTKELSTRNSKTMNSIEEQFSYQKNWHDELREWFSTQRLSMITKSLKGWYPFPFNMKIYPLEVYT